MSRQKVVPMYQKSRNPRQFAFRVKQSEADRICEEARAANITPTTYARLAVAEKLAGRGDRDQRVERRIRALEDLLAKVSEQVASIAFELRDFRERFDETVVTAEDAAEE
jgi:hypothetical protein